MSNGAVAVRVFSVVTPVLWLLTLMWSLSRKRGEDRWYNVFVLLVATIAWWLSEYSAIRLGKYEYSASFPTFLVLPFGGTPTSSDFIAQRLHALTRFAGLPPVECAGAVKQSSWNVPFPVVALEACLVFAFLRLSFFRLVNKGRAAAIAAACFSSVLMVTLAAVLDPVVSNHTWCGGPENLVDRHGLLNFEIWHWFTNETYAGYWFGVPTVNYVAWFVGMGAFSYLARLEDGGPSGVVRRYDRWYKYRWPAVKLLVFLFLIQIPATLLIDFVLVHGPRLGLGPLNQAWELLVIAVLFVSSGLVVRMYGRVHPQPRREWPSTASPGVVLLLCLLALVLEWGGWLNAVWTLSFVITAMVAGLPWILDRLSEKRRAQLFGESRVDDWRSAR
jgi:hypothetical protein